MKKRDYKNYLKDIIMNIEDIEGFIINMDMEEFKKDKRTSNAVIRSLEVIGEAAKKIPQEITSQYPQIPWNKITGMRDRLIHEYFGVDLEIVWKTVKSDLPALKILLENLLKNDLNL
ncbi:MAG: DUF86 domain-containing protein [Candidatus Odinarchaeota archaeon]